MWSLTYFSIYERTTKYNIRYVVYERNRLSKFKYLITEFDNLSEATTEIYNQIRAKIWLLNYKMYEKEKRLF